MSNQSVIAVIGMAVMGQNLALNMAGKGFPVTVFNRTTGTTEQFMRERVKGIPIQPVFSLEDCISTLEKPRRIMLMVKAGIAVDEFCGKLHPLLKPGDVIIDGGNSHYSDTERRFQEARRLGIHFLGTGISGGEEGALRGPSIMPGGDRQGYETVHTILETIAAQVDDGPCCSYLGLRSAGHFVKMIHNGIEYAFMQAISECYDLLRKGYHLNANQISRIFRQWDASEELGSYLVEITWKILDYLDRETGYPLVDLITDQAEQKGTGKWTSQTALDLGIPTPAITASVIARSLSSFKNLRQTGSAPSPMTRFAPPPLESFTESLKKALFLAQVTAFSEGMHLLGDASQVFDYQFPLSEIPRIWKGGCIIRSQLLKRFQRVYRSPDPPLLIHSPEFRGEIEPALEAMRLVIATGSQIGVPLPVLSASLGYLDGFRANLLPANLIQAQRDYFGAHTFQRTDRDGKFHEQWEGDGS